jgi:hypothetical protein
MLGRDSSVGIATHYGLDSLGIEFRWGARFSAPVYTGPGAHPASCIISTGRDVTLSTHNRLAPTLLLPLWAFMARSRVNFTVL